MTEAIATEPAAARGVAARTWGPTAALVAGAVVAVVGTCWYFASNYDGADGSFIGGAIVFVVVVAFAPLIGRWPFSRSRVWWTAAGWAAIGVPGSYFFGVFVLMGSAVCAAGLLTLRAIR